ncbi:MAG: hypothetical protein NWF03_01995 [Candidatus Bathyarchaeota archaeon]|nr:hypothetical protein [Candidatus Bathyarchaeota archaeon]
MSLYMFVLQLVVSYLLVILFLLVMFVIVGDAPVQILFTPYGILLQAIIVGYFWIVLFATGHTSLTGQNKSKKRPTAPKKENT